MKIKLRNQVINVPTKKISNFGMIWGLMFRNKKTNNLLLEFKKGSKMSIHSFFVSFSFLVIWLDKKNNVLGFKFVKPFRLKITSRKPFHKLVEVPLNKKNKKIINYFVGEKKSLKTI